VASQSWKGIYLFKQAIHLLPSFLPTVVQKQQPFAAAIEKKQHTIVSITKNKLKTWKLHNT
jgi:hypothetical protein